MDKHKLSEVLNSYTFRKLIYEAIVAAKDYDYDWDGEHERRVLVFDEDIATENVIQKIK